MNQYDMAALEVAATTVVDENMFDDFRELQLFAMGLISAVETKPTEVPPLDRFASRVIRENIPAGMQTRLTPMYEQVSVKDDLGVVRTIFKYYYEETLEIIEVGI